MFGEVDFLDNKDPKRLFTAKAKEDVELLFITKNDLLDLGLEFKEEISLLFKNAHHNL